MNGFFQTTRLPSATSSGYSSFLRASQPNPVDDAVKNAPGQFVQTYGPDYYNPPMHHQSHQRVGVDNPTPGYLIHEPVQPPSHFPAVNTHAPWPGAATMPYRHNCQACWYRYWYAQRMQVENQFLYLLVFVFLGLFLLRGVL